MRGFDGRLRGRDHFYGTIRRVVELAAGNERTRDDTGQPIGDVLDRIENVGTAAEVLRELNEVASAALDLIAIFAEAFRLGVPESVDGLVDVADGLKAIGWTQ